MLPAQLLSVPHYPLCMSSSYPPFAKQSTRRTGHPQLWWLLRFEERATRPIPGTTKLHRLEENLGAVTVELTEDDLKQINKAVSTLKLEGARLPEAVLKMTGP